MPSINMIAPRRADKRRRERDMRRLVVVIMAELIFAVGLGGWVCTKLLTTSNRIADLNTEISKLRPAVKQIESYRKATKILEPKLELLDQAKGRTMRWYSALDKLTQSMPQSTYLIRINSTAGDKDASATDVSLTGMSISQEKVGETMMRLHEVRELSGIHLLYTRNTTILGASAVEFQIGAILEDEQSGGKTTDAAKGAGSDGIVES